MVIKNINKMTVALSFFFIFTLCCVRHSFGNANPVVLLESSKGNIKIELFSKEAPITVKNFLSYASEGFFNGLIFHRVKPNFMIQGGGFEPKMVKKQNRAPIKNEAANGLQNKRGTIAMARTSIVDSASSQFFINLVDNNFLDYKNNSPGGFGYAVFGRVIEGLDVVDKIAGVKTGIVGQYGDVPLEPVIIKNVKLLKK